MFVSYAQNFEDVMLWRALSHVERGSYIDIGAQDPVVDSVSLAFYRQGWRGIHVEPTPAYAAALRDARPDERVVQAAIAEGRSVIPFFEISGTGISTADEAIAEQHRSHGFAIKNIVVPAVPLSEIFALTQGEVHWLKIDVEGYERQVLSTWGGGGVRPWIVVVESTVPMTQIDRSEAWEEHLVSRDYRHAYFDGLNRFYVAGEHPELIDAFKLPPNVFDNFTLGGQASASFTKRLSDEFAAELAAANAERERLAAAHRDEIEMLKVQGTPSSGSREHLQDMCDRIDRVTVAVESLGLAMSEHQKYIAEQQSMLAEVRELALRLASFEKKYASVLDWVREEIDRLKRNTGDRNGGAES
ncbi:FkbM family methyltransferase [Burkholderia cenocepacia]|nr:FkbM family methyltransferase [Burkholderia cenocepacia]